MKLPAKLTYSAEVGAAPATHTHAAGASTPGSGTNAAQLSQPRTIKLVGSGQAVQLHLMVLVT